MSGLGLRPRPDMIDEKDLRVPMRDGARIGVRVYRPEGGGPLPALFAASPYRYDNNRLPAHPLFLWRETGPIDWYVGQGYAYVHADVRGTGISEGEYRFLDTAEQHDLYDLVEWIARQPWSNGRVGGIGQSYYCMAQWFMGIMNPPHLACIAPFDGLNDPYRYMAYPGGIEGSFMMYWFNSSIRVPNLYPANGENPRRVAHDVFFEVQRHPFYDAYWMERTAAERLENIRVPMFAMGVWSKNEFHLPGVIHGFERAQGPKKLAITRAPTYFAAQRDFSDVAFHRKYLLPFYDRYLKDAKTDYEDRPVVEYEVRNTEAVRRFDTWPPPGTRKAVYHLARGPSGSVASLNDGALLDSAPAADGGATSYSYPRLDWVLGAATVGPHGPDPVRGVLTFASKPLAADMEVAGNGKLVIHASSTRSDMDFLVKVSEQFEQAPGERDKGIQPRSFAVTKGWLRASHAERDPARSTEDVPFYRHRASTPLAPGTIYRLEIPLMPIAYRFGRGSRIRLDIACADSPLTEGLYAHIYRPDKIGTDTIHHDAEHPSRLLLPVLPGHI